MVPDLVVVASGTHIVHARHLLETYGYLALFLSLVIEYIIFLVPGETFLLLASAYASTGRLSLPLVILAAAAGAAVGSNTAYLIGRRGGRPFLFRYSQRFHVSERRWQRLEQFFHRHGAKAVFWARFITVVRILVGYLAGAHAMPYGIFTFYNILSALVWAALIGTLGYTFASNLRLLRHILTDTGLIVLGVLLIIGLVLYTRREREG